MSYLENLEKAVREMRRLQKEFFKTRRMSMLQEARAAEKRVDELLASRGQGELFSNDESGVKQ